MSKQLSSASTTIAKNRRFKRSPSWSSNKSIKKSVETHTSYIKSAVHQQLHSFTYLSKEPTVEPRKKSTFKNLRENLLGSQIYERKFSSTHNNINKNEVFCYQDLLVDRMTVVELRNLVKKLIKNLQKITVKQINQKQINLEHNICHPKQQQFLQIQSLKQENLHLTQEMSNIKVQNQELKHALNQNQLCRTKQLNQIQHLSTTLQTLYEQLFQFQNKLAQSKSQIRALSTKLQETKRKLYLESERRLQKKNIQIKKLKESLQNMNSKFSSIMKKPVLQEEDISTNQQICSLTLSEEQCSFSQ